MKLLKKLNQNYLLLVILIVAAMLRLFPTDWDGGYYTHPDERHIYSVVTQLEFPDSINTFFSEDSSWDPDFYAYGSLPLYLLKFTSSINSIADPYADTYQNLYLTGRSLSAFFDLGTVLLLYVLTIMITSKKKFGLLAAGLYAILVFPIQNSHFYTVDTQLTFWMMATVTSLVAFLKKDKVRYLLIASVTTAAAISTKIPGIFLLSPVGLTFLYYLFATKSSKQSSSMHKIIVLLFFVLLLITCTFLFQPYVFLNWDVFMEDIAVQTKMRTDALVFPYTIQYVGTTAYWYPIKQIALWGMGIVPTILGLGGVLAATIKSILVVFDNFKNTLSHSAQERPKYSDDNGIVPQFQNKIVRLVTESFLIFPKRPSHSLEINISLLILIIMFWIIFIPLGASAVKFMRYYLPLYPLLVIFAVLCIKLFYEKTSRNIIYFIVGITLATTVTWTVAFYSIYGQTHPWVQASDWIHQNIPQQTTLAVEHWDRSLPIYEGSRYTYQQLELYVPDTDQKIAGLLTALENSDYIIVATNRLTDSIPNVPGRYPKTIKYYDLLFSNQLGFSQVAEFTSYPTLFGYEINDQSADESFTVYDHPRVRIFQKTNFDSETVREKLNEGLK